MDRTLGVGSIGRLVIAQPLAGARKPDSHLAQTGGQQVFAPCLASEYIVRGIAALLMVLAAIYFYWGMTATEDDKFGIIFAPHLYAEFLGLAITIIVIDQLYRWRDKVYQQRLDFRLGATQPFFPQLCKCLSHPLCSQFGGVRYSLSKASSRACFLCVANCPKLRQVLLGYRRHMN